MRCEFRQIGTSLSRTNSGRFGSGFRYFGKVWGAARTSGTLAPTLSGQYGLVGIDYDFPSTRRGRQTETRFRPVGEYLA